MTKRYFYLLILTFFGAFSSIFGMEGKHTHLLMTQDNIPGIRIDALKNPLFTRYYIGSGFHTNTKETEAIKEAQERGAKVDFRVGSYSHSKLSDVAHVHVPNLHTKLFLACEQSPTKGSPGKNIGLITSANTTFNAWRNSEAAIMRMNDKRSFLESLAIHQSQSPVKKEKTIITETPKKSHTYDSYKVDFNKSHAERIKKLAESDKENRLLYISSMNWDDADMTDAVVKVAQSGAETRVVVNGSALVSGIDQLTRMSDAGADVYVFDPKREKRHCQHAKLMIRQDGDDFFVSNSTANVTPKGNDEKNMCLYLPSKRKIAEKGIRRLRKFSEKECVQFDHALALFDQVKRERVEKRKINFGSVAERKTKKLRTDLK